MNSSESCRLCLKEDSTCENLFHLNGTELLFTLTSIKIEENDDLSKSACGKCWEELQFAHKWQQTFLKLCPRNQNDYPDPNTEADKMKQELLFDQTVNHSLCKLCLNIKDNTESFFKSNWAECLENLTSIKVLMKDSPIICQDCSTNLTLSYQSQQKFLMSNIKLLSEHIKKEQPSEKTFTATAVAAVDNTKQPCEVCGEQFEITDLVKHIDLHILGKHECFDCDLEFEDNIKYEKHVEISHANFPKHWKCNLCTGVFSYKSMYDLHLRSIHENDGKELDTAVKPRVKADNMQGNKIFVCPDCNTKTSSYFLYERHLKQHAKTKCEICGKMVEARNFKGHTKYHETDPTVCHLCNHVARNSEGLRMHIYRLHRGVTYPCTICKKEFCTGYLLSQHTKKIHTRIRDHVCHLCGKGFYSSYNLNNHVRLTHNKEWTNQCEFCSKPFSSKYALTTHRRQHTNEEPFKCDYCGESFRQKVSLTSHLSTRHNVKQEKTHECDVCGKMLASYNALMSHMQRTHA